MSCVSSSSISPSTSCGSDQFITREMVSARFELIKEVYELTCEINDLNGKLERNPQQVKIANDLKAITLKTVQVIDRMRSDANQFNQIIAQMKASPSKASFLASQGIVDVRSFEERYSQFTMVQMPLQAAFVELIGSIKDYANANIDRQARLVFGKVESLRDKENQTPKLLCAAKEASARLQASIEEREHFLDVCEQELLIPEMKDETIYQQDVSNLEIINEEINSLSINS